MKTVKPNDVVLGYTLKSRIGSGGYGEVWSAEAPGGMVKAMKFIYGFHDEERATTELKSLDRMKLVRHPFLLSLERIQVVSGQLVVITELGDKSLADLYRECKETQGSGIPRDELLKYLRDAADGLDYLAQAHNLQHLDIKPENLLLLGGHVKIADFGLVKEVKDNFQSLMSGLTPTYAPPELFDGKPHRNSDQYSLAIVYQELLTGARPFNGATAAQLAKQHIHGQPALQALPAPDQPVIARALSKDPGLRFGCCRELIDELVQRKGRVAANGLRMGVAPRRDGMGTSRLLNVAPLRNSTSKFSPDKLPGSETTIEWLPPLDPEASPARIGPTLVVGVGRAANLALQRTRQRLVQHFGPFAAVPAISFLCLDTDLAMLAQWIDSGDWFSPAEILPLPLKSSEQYRQAEKWKWLSRRWMYNMPRSGQTEGLRPLGRLAFADHAAAIYQRIKDLVEQIARPEAVAATAEVLGLDPALGCINVFVVTSSAGGVGSGMTIDLAYAIRTILAERTVGDLRLTGILAHSTPRGADEQLLAIANSISLLSEIRQFNQYGYPGDDTCGMPRVENQRVFDDTYLLHLGENLCTADFEGRVRELGDYLFLNVATPCQSFFEQCRSAQDSELRSASIRSFGLAQQGAFAEVSQLLAETVRQRWVDTEQAQARLTNEDRMGALCGKSLVNAEQARLWAAQAIAGPVQEGRKSWRQGVESLVSGNEPGPSARRLDQLARGFWDQLQINSELVEKRPLESVDAPARNSGRAVGQELSRELWNLTSNTKFRLGGARFLAAEWIRLLQQDIAKLQTASVSANSRARAALEQLKSALGTQRISAPAPPSWDQCCDQFAQASAEQSECENAVAYLEPIVAELTSVGDSMRIAAERLWSPSDNRRSDQVPASTDATAAESFPLLQIKNCIRDRLAELAERVDTHLQHNWLHDAGGFAGFLADDAREPSRWSQALTAACNAVIAGAQREISLPDLFPSSGMAADEFAEWISKQLLASKPLLTDGPGEGRVLIGHAGNEPTRAALLDWADRQAVPPGVFDRACGDLVFCHELQKISFAQVIYRLLAGRADALDVAARLHARSDVQWSSLNELFQMS